MAADAPTGTGNVQPIGAIEANTITVASIIIAANRDDQDRAAGDELIFRRLPLRASGRRFVSV